MFKHRKRKPKVLYGNYIYRLNKKDKDNIRTINLFYEDLFKYGNYILDNAFPGEVIKDYELTIYSFLYKIMELLDSMMVMSHQGLHNSSMLVLRTLLESSAQLMYILHTDEHKREERAIVMQMLDIKHGCENVEEFNKRMENYVLYKKFFYLIKDGKYDKWYCYCEGKKVTIRKLFENIGWLELYEKMYTTLCDDVHMSYHMEQNIYFYNSHTDKRFCFRPFRQFDSDKNNNIMLFLLHFIPLVYERFFSLYKIDNMDWKIFKAKVEKELTNIYKIDVLIRNMMSRW